MTTLGPLSPCLAASQAFSVETLSASLYQWSTASTFETSRSALQAISEALRPHQERWSAEDREHPSEKGYRRQALSNFHDLTGSEEEAVPQALAEIASHRKALNLLLESPVARTVHQTAKEHPVETREVREGFESWFKGPPPTVTQTRQGGLSRLFGGAAYWLGSVYYPTFVLGTLLDVLYQGGSALVTGHGSLGALAANAVLLGASLCATHPRRVATREMLESARRGSLSEQEIEAFFERFAHPFSEFRDLATPTGDDDPIEAIRRSAGPGGDPHPAMHATLRTIFDFLNLSRVGNTSLQEDPSGVLYDRITRAIALGTFKHLRWQAVVIHHERLTVLKLLKNLGYKIIFIANHRSHLDILADVALLSDFSPRMVAKQELEMAPELGWTWTHHPLRPGRWKNDGILRGARHVLLDRGNIKQSFKAMHEDARRVLEEGHSLFSYASGTRDDTPDRSVEVGMGTFKNGAFHVAEAMAPKAVIVPVAHYGLGRTLPKSVSDSLFEGAMLNMPAVLSIGEFFEVDDLSVKRMNRMAWRGVWRALAPIQAYMNNQAARAA
jgi:1-acyl-sn-glycerol-3-phosphate acyltransferase